VKRSTRSSCHNNFIRAIAITPDGKKAISASWDKTFKVWDIDKCLLTMNLEEHSDSVSAIAITPDGMRAIFASFGSTLEV